MTGIKHETLIELISSVIQTNFPNVGAIKLNRDLGDFKLRMKPVSLDTVLDISMLNKEFRDIIYLNAKDTDLINVLGHSIDTQIGHTLRPTYDPGYLGDSQHERHYKSDVVDKQCRDEHYHVPSTRRSKEDQESISHNNSSRHSLHMNPSNASSNMRRHSNRIASERPFSDDFKKIFNGDLYGGYFRDRTVMMTIDPVKREVLVGDIYVLTHVDLYTDTTGLLHCPQFIVVSVNASKIKLYPLDEDTLTDRPYKFHHYVGNNANNVNSQDIVDYIMSSRRIALKLRVDSLLLNAFGYKEDLDVRHSEFVNLDSGLYSTYTQEAKNALRDRYDVDKGDLTIPIDALDMDTSKYYMVLWFIEEYIKTNKLDRSNVNSKRLFITKHDGPWDLNIPRLLVANGEIIHYTNITIVSRKLSENNLEILTNETPANSLIMLGKTGDLDVRRSIASNLNSPTEILVALAGDESEGVRSDVFRNPNTPSYILRAVNRNGNDYLKEYVLENPKVPIDLVVTLTDDEDVNVSTRAFSLLKEMKEDNKEKTCL